MSASRGLLAIGVHRPVGMLMVFTSLVVFGLVSLGKLPFDLLPEIDYPSITVRTTWTGAAPEDLEKRVTERLEDALATVGGLERIRSSSRAEVSEILLEFEWGSNLAFLVQNVRERIDRVFLPSGVARPLILRYDPSLDPVMRLALSGNHDLVRLRDVAEQEVERALEGVEGVAAVKVRGGLEDEIQILVDPQRLAAMNVTAEMISQRLQDENLNVPGGKLEEGAIEYIVRTLNEFQSLEEIAAMPVVTINKATVLLSDLATIKRTHKDRDVILRIGGLEAVEIDIYREAATNIVKVAAAVRERLYQSPAQSSLGRQGDGHQQRDRAFSTGFGSKSIVQKLPAGMELTILSDQSQFVRSAISEVQSAALVGGLLAILVCFLFLRRLAITTIIGIAIPVSVIATFGAMHIGGVSMNIMSLGGLALGIGMLVDNAIVVLESITRCRDEGDQPLDAAVRGVSEVGSAVTASTLTTIAVFAPIVFVDGVAGQVFGDQAVTVVSSLLLSLAVALFLIPGLAARFHLESGKRSSEDRPPLFANIRGGLLNRNNPGTKKRSKLRFVIGLISIAAWLGLSQWRTSLITPYAMEIKAGGWGVPEEVTALSASLRFWSFAFLLPFLWTGGRVTLQVIGRLLADLFGLASVAARYCSIAVLVPLGIVIKPLAHAVEVGHNKLEAHYPQILRSALQRPGLILGTVALMGIATWMAAGKVGRELLPEVMQGEITAELYFPSGNPLSETDLVSSRIDSQLRKIDGVSKSVVVSGADRESVSSNEEGPHVSRITISIEETGNRRALESQVETELRAFLAKQPEIARFELSRPTLLATKTPLEIEIISEDFAQLRKVSDQVMEQLHGLPGLVDLRSSIRRGNPEVLVVLNRERLAAHNLNLSQIAARLRMAVEGEVSTTFAESDERLDVRVRADFAHMSSVEQLRDFPINPESERPLPLSAVAELHTTFGPSEILHLGSQRAAVLSGSIASNRVNLGALTTAIEEKLAQIEVPYGVELRIGGQKHEMEEALASLNFALLLAIFLVYAVMAGLFESLLQPLIIMASVPLAAIGAIWALLATGTPLSVVALLGLVVLAGIVVNNAIVLVDRINRNRDNGLELDDAILEAGKARLRPILMTTFTTVLGMLPLTGWLWFIGSAEGTELRAPMALVVIAGLLSSTMLTLVVIPVIYRVLTLLTTRPANV